MKRKSLMKHIFISAFLLCLWPVLTLAYIVSSDISFTILSYNHGKENIAQVSYDKLTKGKKIKGSFKAEDNNLGIVAVRFAYAQRVPYRFEDNFAFRIKEQNAKMWYYQNTYRAGIIYDVPFFPFGFPQIENSKGKYYQFEIESLKGNAQNALSLSQREPILATKYQVSKAALLQDKGQFALFISKKFLNNFNSFDGIFISIVFLLPFVFYILLLIKRDSKLGKSIFFVINVFGIKSKSFIKGAAVYITLGLIILNILLLQLTDNFMYIALTVLWFSAVSISNRKSSLSYGIGLILLAVTPFLFYLHSIFIAEYTATWAFLFLLVGIVQTMIELRKQL